MNKKHDRSYLELIFSPENIPKVTEETRLREDLKMDETSVKLLTAYVKLRYGANSSLQPKFKTIGDIDAYIYFEYYCNNYWYL